MTCTEVLGGLGSWTVKLADETPDEVLSQLGFFGHVVIVRGRVDVSATSSSLLAAARYVGVLRDRSKDRRTLEGDGMLFWLGDEDDKSSKVLEAPVNLSGASLATAVAAVLPPAVHTGTINTAAGTYTGKHQYETPRAALDTITQAFGVEYRVNGTATIDVGTQAQLYRTSPVVIIAAKNAGQDLDLTSLGAAFDVSETIRDYTGRVLLLGSSYDDGTTTTFATGSADAPVLPYLDPWGNGFRPIRMISESGTTSGSVTQRAQLQLNRFNRAATALKVTATDYDIGAGSFAVGDNAYVYDPANGIVDATRTIDFRGEAIHPDIVRISGATWPVTDEHTVAFRTNTGAWVDLTPWMIWESGGGEITVGDLPKSLTSGGGNPVQDRADSLPDATIPTAPTGLSLSTFAVVDPKGFLSAVIRASWTAPTVNTDGTVITDLASYFVRWRVIGRPAWQGSSVAVTQFDVPVLIDTDYEVQVAAVDRWNHSSAYTSSVTIHASVDTAAPAAPSDPTVTSYLGQLRIAWNGLTNVGAAMPNDFNRVDVHVSATTGFTPSTSTLVSSLSTAGVAYATAPYGSTRYVKLVAYDNAGNASAPSGQVSGSTVQVADGDVAALSVGKLTSGTGTFDLVMAGRATTALTGARVEMNSLGFQKFDASNTTLVSITGTEALLTGIFKTALTGRRIEIGAAGAAGEVNFYAPDNTRAVLRAWTEPGGVEAVQLGVPMASTTNTLWNRINYNTDEWANYRAVKHEFHFMTGGYFTVFEVIDRTSAAAHWQRLGIDGTSLTYRDSPSFANPIRFMIDENGLQYWDGDGVNRLQFNTTALYFRDHADQEVHFAITANTIDLKPWGDTGGRVIINNAGSNTTISAAIQQFTDPGYGNLMQVFRNPANGVVSTEFKDWPNTGYVLIAASQFFVASDIAGKQDIKDADVSAMDAIRPVKVKTFRRKGGAGAKARSYKNDDGHTVIVAEEEEPAAPGPVEIGWSAQDMPEELVGQTSGGLAIDLSATVAYQWRALQELDERLDALERKGVQVPETKGAK